jgi:predicted DNA-binding transcriptional regulator AlpA
MTRVFEKPDQAKFLSQSAVLSLAIPEFPISASTLLRMVKKSQFPRPLKIGGRYFWDAASVADWKADRIREACTTPFANPAQE